MRQGRGILFLARIFPLYEVAYHVIKIDEGAGLKGKLYGRKVKMSEHALVNGNDIDLSENEGIAEYNAANTTWGEGENRESRLGKDRELTETIRLR